MKFLCGCDLDRLIQFGYKPRLDSEGFMICPDHQLREQGWRTKQDLALGRLTRAGR